MTPADDARLVEALVAGNETTVSQATTSIVAGSLVPRAERLRDMRPLGIADVTLDSPDHFQHLGVTNVSDYFLCLLEKRHHLTSRDILREALPQCDGIYSCEVCNDAVYPIDDQIRSRLVSYWERRLSCP